MTSPPARWFEIQLYAATVPPEVVFRALAAETVLLNVKTGQYHGLDPVGARFFEVMRDAASVSAACDILAVEFDQPQARIRTDFLGFLDELEQRGLVVLTSSSVGRA